MAIAEETNDEVNRLIFADTSWAAARRDISDEDFYKLLELLKIGVYDDIAVEKYVAREEQKDREEEEQT